MTSNPFRILAGACLGLCLSLPLVSGQSVRVIKLIKEDQPAPLEVTPAPTVKPTPPPMPPTSGMPVPATTESRPTGSRTLKLSRGNDNRALELTSASGEVRPSRLPPVMTNLEMPSSDLRPDIPSVLPQLPVTTTPRPAPSGPVPPIQRVPPDQLKLPTASTSAGIPPVPLAPPPTLQSIPSNMVVPATPPQGVAAGQAQADMPIFWASVESLMWWVRGQPLPTALTATTPGVGLGWQTGNRSQIELGDPGLNNEMRSGARFAAGMWLDSDRTVGFSGDYFFLSRSTDALQLSLQQLNRPFVTPGTDAPTLAASTTPGLMVVIPTLNRSDLTVTGTSSAIEGASALLRFRMMRVQQDPNCPAPWRMDVQGGYRFLGISESLTLVEQNEFSIGTTDPAPILITSQDSFQTRNRFNGFDLGLINEFRRGDFSLEVSTRLAMGWMDQRVTIFGQQTTTDALGVRTAPTGGMLAQNSNIGSYRRSQGMLLPELGLTLGWQMAGWLRLTTGYNLIYVPDVVRPGDQVDSSLVQQMNTAGSPLPAFAFRSSDMWLQGVKLGVELNY